MMLIHIGVVEILVQPLLWRIVGFASSVVGFLCYALSSSFTHLFGDWNLLKIIIYSALSCIICSFLLYAKKWSVSKSLVMKAQMGFLVLMLISVYSFFYDKAVNGSKPDVLSLVSCGAFAFMSFSLSRLTDLGFEVDLLNFFLGCLILLLMKIHLMLGLVGAVFGYSLTLFRSSLDSQTEIGTATIMDHVVLDVDSAADNNREFHKKLFEETFSRLQKLSIEDVHKMPWMDLKEETKRWIEASRVFLHSSSASDLSFVEDPRGSMIQLLNFADVVAEGSISPERLFRILDMFEVLRDLIPAFESLFSEQDCVFLRNEAITVWKRVGKAITGFFMELENRIREDQSKAVTGGVVHPVTRYVMNYLRLACDYRQTLEQVFEDRVESSSSLSGQMSRIVELLESNLEAKSKTYKDTALCYVFMMNNGRYIVHKAKQDSSELGSLLGHDWIQTQIAKVGQYHVNYQRSSWNTILSLLELDTGSSVAPNVAAKTMKQNIKLFNKQFEDICRVQSAWVIFDEQLKEEMRISLEKILLPAYADFIGRFQNLPEVGKHADKYIRHGLEDIEARLGDLFQGSSGPTGGRK